MTGTDPADEARLGRIQALIETGDLIGAARCARDGLAEQPQWAALWGLYGGLLATTGFPGQALEALERACALAPEDPEPLRNLAALRLARAEWAAAHQAATALARLRPREAETHRLLGGAAAGLGDLAAAEARLQLAVAFDPRSATAWLDRIAVLRRQGRLAKATQVAEAALAANPGEPRLVEVRLDLAMQRLSDGGDSSEPGRGEGLDLQAAHDALVAALDAGAPPETLPSQAGPVFMRMLAHEAMDRLGSFEALGRRWAEAGDARNLLMQLPRARLVREDRLELLHQHRLWGRQAEEAAARTAAPARPPRGPRERLRLGFSSSDLRRHAVGAFALPLFERLDRGRFEVFVYSVFPGDADPVQQAIAAKATAYRHAPRLDAVALAERIAADRLDVLLEIGGPTGSNRPEAMARRLADVQASWLGYPHSLGLSTIDYILVDRFLAPPDPDMLVEKPLPMPRSWIALGDYFHDQPGPAAEPPVERNGYITFGTANSSYKYSPIALDAWARVLAAVPDSRFLVVRPEAEAPLFRDRMIHAFAAHGVAAERVRFAPVRGGHLPFYDQIDISLDTLPLTGGTTTCESLWMGTPVVSLVGEALYERLSYAILAHCGLADLTADSVEGYVAAAAALAADRSRLRDLRRGLRARLRASPLGDAAGFARDFYDLMASTVA